MPSIREIGPPCTRAHQCTPKHSLILPLQPRPPPPPLKTVPHTQQRNTTTRNPGSEIFIQTTHLSHCSTSALARMRASTHETCPPKDAIHTGDWPSLHARISAHPNTALPCTCNRIPPSPTQDNTPHSTTQHKHPQPSSSKQLTSRIAARQPSNR